MKTRTTAAAVAILALLLSLAAGTGPRAGMLDTIRRQGEEQSGFQGLRSVMEQRDSQALVKQLYRGFLNRSPKRNELLYWQRRLAEGLAPESLAEEFMASDEFFVRSLYLGLMGREPDSGGLENYTESLARGGSRRQVIREFLASSEFRGSLR